LAAEPESSAGVVVFSADGAGNFQNCSRSLRQTVALAGVPIQVETFEWSHGYCRVILDQVAFGYAKAQGRRMAETVTEFCARNPRARVYLMGHSAGVTVALIAAAHMPPGLVEGVLLLSGSVSADYDLRPALRNVRGYVDVFYSRRDWWYLGVATRLVGTSDRLYSPTSGRIGFRPAPESPEDEQLFARLRQRSWQPDDRWTGNLGGHYGNYQPEFLRAHILPILLGQKN
jgi:pimeloyl-ACP methyl ester carboxylesterase